MIYLDYAATTPMCQEAIAAYAEAASVYFGNESSLHDIGTKAKQLLALCRRELAAMINGEAEGIYFTSGGTEANVLAIRSLAAAYRHKGNHLITTEIEHASLHHLFKQLETEGYTVTYLPVDRFGRIRLADLERAITPKTILASIQHANSEIGTIQPLADISRLLRAHRVLFHSDCVQTFAKIQLDVQKIGLDSYPFPPIKCTVQKGSALCTSTRAGIGSRYSRERRTNLVFGRERSTYRVLPPSLRPRSSSIDEWRTNSRVWNDCGIDCFTPSPPNSCRWRWKAIPISVLLILSVCPSLDTKGSLSCLNATAPASPFPPAAPAKSGCRRHRRRCSPSGKRLKKRSNSSASHWARPRPKQRLTSSFPHWRD
ncbi:putative cysteine desulfurase NifS [Geobacillus sp. BCO2]|nr:putative cysteine desulfurase NifS [Geobacillus sp. BCO2]